MTSVLHENAEPQPPLLERMHSQLAATLVDLRTTGDRVKALRESLQEFEAGDLTRRFAIALVDPDDIDPIDLGGESLPEAIQRELITAAFERASQHLMRLWADAYNITSEAHGFCLKLQNTPVLPPSSPFENPIPGEIHLPDTDPHE